MEMDEGQEKVAEGASALSWTWPICLAQWGLHCPVSASQIRPVVQGKPQPVCQSPLVGMEACLMCTGRTLTLFLWERHLLFLLFLLFLQPCPPPLPKPPAAMSPSQHSACLGREGRYQQPRNIPRTGSSVMGDSCHGNLLQIKKKGKKRKKPEI